MDLLQKRGKYPPPPGVSSILGVEVGGVVVNGDTFPSGTPVACLLPGLSDFKANGGKPSGIKYALVYAAGSGATVCLNYKELGASLADEVLKYTEGRGVDIVLDCVGSSLFDQTLKSLKTDGMVYEGLQVDIIRLFRGK
ncbi:quinone oxidoreductase, putative [Eimeria maxima]|uniref:Quinone oxidoreductase, putative n=1 Tax=Eimeria maxima TaxID=5804 RepID=U6LY83_EIMMA|nr:quinone oxidoreductase, putative [Eimeria maxima]CDJ56922.1 quinone oxidoreductase, putative [Eimeria maxima]